MRRQHPAIGALERRDGLVLLVDDHVLAARDDAFVVEHALPPAERGLSRECLRSQVQRVIAGWNRLEPHRPELLVEDQRSALTVDLRAQADVLEVRDHEVTRRELAAGGRGERRELRWVQTGRGYIAQRALCGPCPDR